MTLIICASVLAIIVLALTGLQVHIRAVNRGYADCRVEFDKAVSMYEDRLQFLNAENARLRQPLEWFVNYGGDISIDVNVRDRHIDKAREVLRGTISI